MSSNSFHRFSVFFLTLSVTGALLEAQEPIERTSTLLIERADELRATLLRNEPEHGSERILVERLAVGGGLAYTLELEPTETWTHDAKVMVYGADGVRERTPPRGRTFRGRAVGVPGSSVVLRQRASGELRGMLDADGRSWLIRDIGSPDPDLTWREGRGRQVVIPPGAAGSLHVQEVDLEARSEEGFTCDQAALGPGTPPLLQAEPVRDLATLKRMTEGSMRGSDPTHTVRIAFATDWEYYNQFGDEDEAIDYIGDLIGFISTIYEDEVQTNLLASYVEIYTSNNDPYTESQGSCSLYQFGKYWNDNRTGVDRTLAHLLSGRPSNIGVAWIGVLCNGAFNPSFDTCGIAGNTGGDYGYTGGIDGNFNPSNPQIIWDVAGVAHEIGHNFNSPHTHCYNGLGGNSNPVDECYNGQADQGCYAGAESLPGGSGSGTIMSYCHFLGGGFSNISLTFGRNHAFGVEPDRVPDRMRSHVLSRAGSNPACLALTFADQIFSDGFESGNTSSWSP